MINFSFIKMVLYDFDDTLCIHEFHREDPNYNIKVLTKGKDTWNTGTPNKYMKEFMELCSDKGIRQGLISWTESFKHMKGKEDWVSENYGISLENFCVCSADAKIDMMLSISKAYKFDPNQILIVDDRTATLEKASSKGFQACTPMEIVNFFTNTHRKACGGGNTTQSE